MTGHGKEVCACGAVISQCRCFHGAEIPPRVVCQTCPKCLVAALIASDNKEKGSTTVVDRLKKYFRRGVE